MQEEELGIGMEREAWQAGCTRREKPRRGPFGPGDWECGKCGNVNWARRPRCNLCAALKHPKQEARTGVAGGYDDRGVVEYVRRSESDEEYDHFGRRKRRKELRQPMAGRSEDETEEDEGDLSKYDLSEWGDSGNNGEK